MIICPECGATDAHRTLPMSGENREIETPAGRRRVCDDCQSPPRRATCCEHGKLYIVLRDGEWGIEMQQQWRVIAPAAFCPWCGERMRMPVAEVCAGGARFTLEHSRYGDCWAQVPGSGAIPQATLARWFPDRYDHKEAEALLGDGFRHLGPMIRIRMDLRNAESA